ncbi:MAG: helix-turn-helix domain-containing protein [Nitrospira sp.]|nr:helix-turn-helix domain-containing protein [Nitrospira sp.]MDH4246086.1 helix-turn-helix domain-containing protein [Nitrospira sp.]MDH4356956.1 helix-turn-helix domain-containing protein [Nitrospira sp.]MDH5318925.1 helix-turn-helix domain-containing protein [Nitrospira sp.]
MMKRLNAASTEDFLSTEEAADYLEVKPTVVRNYLWEGKLTTYKFKTLTLLSRQELDDWKKHRSTG